MNAFFKKYNTLRNQIFIFFSVIFIVAIVSMTLISYMKFSSFYQQSLDKQLMQTSIEVNSAIDAKYNQLNTIAAQLATDDDVQKIMYDLVRDRKQVDAGTTFKHILSRYYPYVDYIYDYRFYTLNGAAIYPHENTLQQMLSEETIRQARLMEGKLLLLNTPSKNDQFSYAVKVIRLIDHGYRASGILVLKLRNDYFNTNFEDARNFIQVYDADSKFITGQSTPSLRLFHNRYTTINGEDFHIAKAISPTTNWTVVVAQSIETYQIEMSKIKLFMIFVALVVVSFAFILSWYLSSYMTKPLHRLITTMKKNPRQTLTYIDESKTSVEMYTLHHTYNEFIVAIEQLIKEVYEKQRLQQHAELKALQSQIHPHFLYNTLNAFYWKLLDDDNDKLANDILAMSELFKYSMTSTTTSNDIVTLQDEIHHIENYLQLMKMRIGDRLTLHIHIEEQLKEIRMPKLLLQPLVENAIIHGIEPQRSDAFIKICAVCDGDQHVRITIVNNGRKISPQQLQQLNTMQLDTSKHVGIQNIRLRLKLHYSEQIAQKMQFTSDDTTGTAVELTLLKEVQRDDTPSITY